MLTEKGRAALAEALDALRDGDRAPWAALAPLARLPGEGTDVSIDFSAEADLGAALVVVRPASALPSLTARQTAVAVALADGLSNKDIARRLGISPTTVKDHVAAVLRRLGARNRTEAAARLHGLKTSV